MAMPRLHGSTNDPTKSLCAEVTLKAIDIVSVALLATIPVGALFWFLCLDIFFIVLGFGIVEFFALVLLLAVYDMTPEGKEKNKAIEKKDVMEKTHKICAQLTALHEQKQMVLDQTVEKQEIAFALHTSTSYFQFKAKKAVKVTRKQVFRNIFKVQSDVKALEATWTKCDEKIEFLQHEYADALDQVEKISLEIDNPTSEEIIADLNRECDGCRKTVPSVSVSRIANKTPNEPKKPVPFSARPTSTATPSANTPTSSTATASSTAPAVPSTSSTLTRAPIAGQEINHGPPQSSPYPAGVKNSSFTIPTKAKSNTVAINPAAGGPVTFGKSTASAYPPSAAQPVPPATSPFTPTKATKMADFLTSLRSPDMPMSRPISKDATMSASAAETDASSTTAPNTPSTDSYEDFDYVEDEEFRTCAPMTWKVWAGSLSLREALRREWESIQVLGRRAFKSMGSREEQHL